MKSIDIQIASNLRIQGDLLSCCVVSILHDALEEIAYPLTLVYSNSNRFHTKIMIP